MTVTLVVSLTMLASLTLLPAMLGFLGEKVLRRAERGGQVAASRPGQDGGQASGFAGPKGSVAGRGSPPSSCSR